MASLTLTVNGRTIQVPVGTTLLTFVADHLSASGVSPDHVVAELNGRITPRAAFEAETLKDGDVLELVTFVGGG